MLLLKCNVYKTLPARFALSEYFKFMNAFRAADVNVIFDRTPQCRKNCSVRWCSAERF